MLTYIIDGNNLIGKIKDLKILQNKDKEAAREKLAFLIDNYCSGKNMKVTLHFDGFQNVPIGISSARIVYSEKKAADEKIKDEIARSKNPRNIVLITSDNNLREFARVCGASVMSSADFEAILSKRSEMDEEEKRIRSINNVEEFKRIFKEKK